MLRAELAVHLNLWSPADPTEEAFHTDAGGAGAIDVDVALLYREEAPRLRRLFGSRVRQSDKVADLIHTAFARLLGLDREKRVQLAEPRAYLTRIAVNLVRDEAKTAARRSEKLHVSADDCVLATPDPHAMLEARDMLHRVNAAISSLPDRTREIFMAHRFEDMTYPQIAERMGVSIKTVEKHISLALRELHRSLGSDA
ncbi:RNA polymerase sigma factor [Sphingomonas sp. KC8]|uniref:RNA polymerase sigma factor n=1 Tax=Sphingomonas sp. KC8 TaxID=1030157 RepID=UPI000248B249|nr:sigma-70 family RNA polymerase sigma factor [Sphingomonas sp. KC8]ARS26973.1 hypothetical protein KC8_06675 [Sphingomonas sp. KC8]